MHLLTDQSASGHRLPLSLYCHNLPSFLEKRIFTGPYGESNIHLSTVIFIYVCCGSKINFEIDHKIMRRIQKIEFVFLWITFSVVDPFEISICWRCSQRRCLCGSTRFTCGSGGSDTKSIWVDGKNSQRFFLGCWCNLLVGPIRIIEVGLRAHSLLSSLFCTKQIKDRS